MSSFAGPSSRHAAWRLTGAAVLVAQVAGCSAWHRMPGALDGAESQAIHHGLVELRSGARVVLDGIVVRPDSVTGYDDDARARVAFARSQVVGVSENGFDLRRSLTLVVGAAAAVAAVAALAILVALKIGGPGTLVPSPTPAGS